MEQTGLTIEDTYIEVDILLQSIDLCHRKKAYELLVAHYEYATDDYDYLWRLAMTTHMYVECWIRHESFKKDEPKVKKLQFEANAYATQSLKLNSENADVQQWYAQTLGGTTRFLGNHDKIIIGYEYKKHIEKAISLRPKDARLRHLHGRFCFETAGLTWIERKLASLFYEQPPTSTFQEAKEDFEKAENLAPLSSVDNLLQLARCHICLGDKVKGKQYLLKAKSIEATTPEDRIAVNEVTQLIRKL